MPKSGLSGVTFDLWETLFLDIPELDRHRDMLRCQGLQKVLRRYRIDVKLHELTRGLDESSNWLVNVWRTGEQVPTQEQIRYIVASATRERSAIPQEAMKELEEAYTSPGLMTPPAVNVDTGPVLTKLRTRGYKIGLICNTGRGPGRIIRQLLTSSLLARAFSAISMQPCSRTRLAMENPIGEYSLQQRKNWDFLSARSCTLGTILKRTFGAPNRQA